MHIRHLTLALTLLVASASPLWAQFRVASPMPGEQYHVELGAMFWVPEPGIVIGSPSLAAIDPAGVDFAQQFGFPRIRFADLRGVIKGGKHKLRVSRVPLSYAETVTVQQTAVINGSPVSLNGTATGAVEWDLWRFGYEYDFATGDRGYVGFIAEVKYNRLTASLTAPQLGAGTTVTDVTVPAPQFGLVARAYPQKWVSLTGEFTGLKVPSYLRKRLSSADVFDVNMREFEVYATISATRFLGVQGGYRHLTADYVVDDETGDLRLKGLYIGGLIRF